MKNNNFEEVIKHFSKLEDKAGKDFILNLKKQLVALAKSNMSYAVNKSPIKTGALRKSIKVKSRSRKGNILVKTVWNEIYAYVQNNTKDGKNEGFINKIFEDLRDSVDAKGQQLIINEMNKVLKG